jgi:RimJ/RimL family protein N-acetyltransferase
MDGPIVETERLILRPPRAEDFDPWAEMMQDAEGSRFIGGPQPKSASWRGFCSVAGAWAMFGFAMFSVVEKDTGRWIGRLGPWRPEAWPGPEVGWGLVRDAWGKGYATEGAAAAIDWAFDHLGWTDVIHCIDPLNAPSQAVARRLGSSRLGEGTLPAPFDTITIDLWGQSATNWRRRKG